MKVVASAVTWVFPSLKWLSLVDCVENFGHLMEAQVSLISINFLKLFQVCDVALCIMLHFQISNVMGM
jgi:hypothetical protein